MENEDARPDHHRVEIYGMVARSILLLVLLAIYWCLSGSVLWWAYDIPPLIRGGYYERHQALVLVEKMGLIVTVLTSLVWLFVKRRSSSGPQWLVVWTVGWKTSLILAIYVFVILARAEFKSAYDDAAFLGNVNSQFLSEYNFLSFLLFVAPIMGCVSGALYYVQERVLHAIRGL